MGLRVFRGQQQPGRELDSGPGIQSDKRLSDKVTSDTRRQGRGARRIPRVSGMGAQMAARLLETGPRPPTLTTRRARSWAVWKHPSASVLLRVVSVAQVAVGGSSNLHTLQEESDRRRRPPWPAARDGGSEQDGSGRGLQTTSIQSLSQKQPHRFLFPLSVGISRAQPCHWPCERRESLSERRSIPPLTCKSSGRRPTRPFFPDCTRGRKNALSPPGRWPGVATEKEKPLRSPAILSPPAPFTKKPSEEEEKRTFFFSFSLLPGARGACEPRKHQTATSLFSFCFFLDASINKHTFYLASTTSVACVCSICSSIILGMDGCGRLRRIQGQRKRVKHKPWR